MSVVNRTADGGAVEVGTVGNEGMAGLAALLEAEASESQTLARVPGTALRLPATALRAAGCRAAWRTSWRAAGWVAGVGAGVSLAAYVAAPCVAWHAQAGDPAVRAAAAARARFAAHVAERCEGLGATAEPPAVTCRAETEAADLPAVPRACLGRAHRTFRLHVADAAGGQPPRPSRAPLGGLPSTSPAREALGRVAAALAAAYPDVPALTPLTRAAPGAGPAGATLAGLWGLGFRTVEVVRDGRVLGRLAVAPAVGRQ